MALMKLPMTFTQRSKSWGLFVIFAFCCSAFAEADEFKAGAAKRVITPDSLLPITGGLGPGAPSKEKQGDLMARAIVMQKGETTVAVVGLDLLGFPGILCERVRKKVARIPARNIMIGSTHTHSAPDCYGLADGKGGAHRRLEFYGHGLHEGG